MQNIHQVLLGKHWKPARREKGTKKSYLNHRGGEWKMSLRHQWCVKTYATCRVWALCVRACENGFEREKIWEVIKVRMFEVSLMPSKRYSLQVVTRGGPVIPRSRPGDMDTLEKSSRCICHHHVQRDTTRAIEGKCIWQSNRDMDDGPSLSPLNTGDSMEKLGSHPEEVGIVKSCVVSTWQKTCFQAAT